MIIFDEMAKMMDRATIEKIPCAEFRMGPVKHRTYNEACREFVMTSKLPLTEKQLHTMASSLKGIPIVLDPALQGMTLGAKVTSGS